jgi:hypothetical protein
VDGIVANKPNLFRDILLADISPGMRACNLG